MKYLLILLLICQNSLLPALLSPINQSLKEIETILQRPELSLALGQENEIEKIVHTKDGYEISTKEISVKVEVIYDREQQIGARSFTLLFHKPVREIKG